MDLFYGYYTHTGAALSIRLKVFWIKRPAISIIDGLESQPKHERMRNSSTSSFFSSAKRPIHIQSN